MSDFSGKGGRAGSKQRKYDKKAYAASSSSSSSSRGGQDGKYGVEAWSTNSIADFQADMELLRAQMQQQTTESNDNGTSSTASSSTSSSASSSSPSTSLSPAPVSSSSSLGTIDGSLLEGGGQVLRNSIAYAALLGRPIRIHSIRAGRVKGGLKAQHLKGIQLVHTMTSGALRNAEINSKEIEYEPGCGNFQQIESSSSTPMIGYNCDIGTAGATGLLIQCALPVALFMPHPVELTLRGGTNASMAPLIDYSMMVFGPLMQKWFGVDIKFELVQRGFFPKGGGIVKVHTQPVESLRSIRVTERGRITKITGLSLVTSRLPAHIAQRMASHAQKVLHKEMRDVPIEIESVLAPESESPMGEGVFLILLAHTSTGCILGSSSLGERGLQSETVAERCVESLTDNIYTGGCMDEYCQDQVIIFMALAEGTSVIKTGPLTLHTRTCLVWAQWFTGERDNDKSTVN